MTLSFKPVDTIPGNTANESRELFAEFIESGARFALLEGATEKDRSRLASASATFNRQQGSNGARVKVRARGNDTYLERVETTQE